MSMFPLPLASPAIMDEIDRIRKSLSCIICLNVLHSPARIKGCGHVYCLTCIEKALEVVNKCPLCGYCVPLHSQMYEPQPDYIVQYVEELFDLFDKNCVNNDKQKEITPFVPSHKRLLYKPGDLIEVLPRLWPGINKPGGPARILVSNEEDNVYNVKYVLTNTIDTDIPAVFITSATELERSSRRNNNEKRKPEDSNAPVTNKRQQPKKLLLSAYHPCNKSNSVVRPVLLASALDDADIKLLNTFASQFNAIIATQFDESVTHLIVTLSKSTMKYMQSLMHGIWIVSSEWMAESIENNAVLIEEKYEVIRNSKATMDYGPRRAREARESHVQAQGNQSYSTLFQSLLFYFHGNFAYPLPSKSDLKSLVLCGNGSIVASEDELPPHHKDVIVVTDGTSSSTLLQYEYRNYTWLLDCITNFNVDRSNP